MGKRMDIESHNTLKISFAERIPSKSAYDSAIEDLSHIISPHLDNSGYLEMEIIRECETFSVK